MAKVKDLQLGDLITPMKRVLKYGYFNPKYEAVAEIVNCYYDDSFDIVVRKANISFAIGKRYRVYARFIDKAPQDILQEIILTFVDGEEQQYE